MSSDVCTAQRQADSSAASDNQAKGGIWLAGKNKTALIRMCSLFP